MWKLFQVTIITGVLFSNVHWKWTPNPTAAGFLAILAAYLATVLLVRLIGIYGYLKRTHRRNRRQRTPSADVSDTFLPLS